MKSLTIFFWMAVFALIFSACSFDPADGWSEKDLMQHGLPIRMLVPDDVTVKKSELGLQQDFTIDGGDDYGVQVFVAERSGGSVANIVAELRTSIENNSAFHEIVHEQEDGFVYEFKFGPERSNFGFRRVKLQGDYEYVIQNAMGRIFDKEQAMNMFEAVIP